MAGWRRRVFLNAGLVTAVLITNITATIWASSSYGTDGEFGIRIMYRGSCAKTQSMMTVITDERGNRPRTLPKMLARYWGAEHQEISRWRRILWLFLGLSTVPLNLLYNSAVFATIAAQSKYDYSVGDKDYFAEELKNTTRWSHTGIGRCLDYLRHPFVTKSRNVSIVVSGDAKNRSGCKGKILSTPVYYSEHSECMNLDVDFYFSATCGIDAIKNDCNSGKDWYVMGCKVEECWVEKLDEKCKLQFSSGIIPIIAAQPKRDMQQYEGRKAREEIQEHRKKPELLKAAWSLVDKASEGRNLLRTEKGKLESGLHGSEAITTALSGRLQIPSSGTKSGGGFPGFHKDMNNQDVELGFFALPDTMHRAKVQAPVSSRVDTLLEIHIAASNITRTRTLPPTRLVKSSPVLQTGGIDSSPESQRGNYNHPELATPTTLPTTTGSLPKNSTNSTSELVRSSSSTQRNAITALEDAASISGKMQTDWGSPAPPTAHADEMEDLRNQISNTLQDVEFLVDNGNGDFVDAAYKGSDVDNQKQHLIDG